VRMAWTIFAILLCAGMIAKAQTPDLDRSVDRLGRLIKAQSEITEYEADTIVGSTDCCIAHDPELAAYLRSRQSGWKKKIVAIDAIKAERP
jgi:hypothetical protein